MTRAAVATTALAGVLVTFALALPARAVRAPSASWDPPGTVVAGAIHVHTTRSDGTGSIDEVAAAARRAGLQFVISTDHGDGTRRMEPPSYRSGVLCLEGVEITTSGGHYVALDLPQAPFPIGGEARDVAEDVTRLGGYGIVAHGDSPKSDLRWQDWRVPVDGIEWMNLDSQWRSDTYRQLGRALVAYWFRKPETLASLAARPAALLQQWDELTRTRKVIAFGATDAHAQSLLGEAGPAFSSRLGFPSYEACMRTMSTRVSLERPLSGLAEKDARVILDALRSGHHYTALDAVAAPATFEFTARAGERVARQGDILDVGTPVELDARVAAPLSCSLVLFRGGVPVAETDGGSLSYVAAAGRAAYRIEATIRHTPGNLPWIVSNPIFVGRWADPEPPADPNPHGPVRDLMPEATDIGVWHVERDARSTGSVIGTARALTLHYALASGTAADQMVAGVRSVPEDLGGFDRIALRASASRPLRLVVQLRVRGERNPARWRRSIYLDRTPRTVTVPFAEMHGVDGAAGPAPLDSIGSLMLLVDANNTAPGTTGEIDVSEIALER